MYSAEFDPDALRVVTTSADHTVRVWEATSSKLLTTFKGQSNAASSWPLSKDSIVRNSARTARVSSPLLKTKRRGFGPFFRQM